MKLIINADDFGMTHGVTNGILDAMRTGIVSSTTMMVNMHGTQGAADIARKNPDLSIGLHVNISLGTPLTSCDSLTRDGKFMKPNVLKSDEDYLEEDLYKEINAQYERFVSLVGRKPTHMDSHLYTHQKFMKVRAAVKRVADERCIPVRDCDTQYYPRIHFVGNFKVEQEKNREDVKEKCLRILRTISEFPIAELMVHPALPDRWLLENSGYNSQRFVEYKVLTDEDILEFILESDITLTGYQGVKN